MIRHNIVVPGVGTPPAEPCGGSAWCASCNAEMIDLEQLAFGLATSYERRSEQSKQGIADPGHIAAQRWAARIPYAEGFRRSARKLIRFRHAEASRPAAQRMGW